MKFRHPILAAVTSTGLLLAAITVAQDVPPPPPPTEMAQPDQPLPPSDPMPPSPLPSSSTPPQTGSTKMETPAGQLTVKSTMPPAPPAGPAPSFEHLSGGGKSISEDQAAAYPLLANDFINADRNRDNRISKSEYKNWVSQK